MEINWSLTRIRPSLPLGGLSIGRLSGLPTAAVFYALSPGEKIEVDISPAQVVKEGDKLVVLEAMKMLTTVCATADRTVKEVHVRKGDQIDSDDLLIRLE